MDCALFSQLYMTCQARGANLHDFFCHGNHAYPPSISKFGEIRSCTKSDLTVCLEKLSPSAQSDCPDVDAVLLDGAAIVNMLKPEQCKTFQQYGEQFLHYIRSQLNHVTRVDVVWDVYNKRVQGIRRRVEPSSSIPHNWEGFLRVNENKTELFHFLAQLCAAVESVDGKIIISTCSQSVISNVREEFSEISPCNHEEADSRLLLHCMDCVRHGHKKLLLRTVDTDVIVIAISCFHRINANELWIAFGTGKHFRYIAIHNIVASLGPEKSSALPTFHAFTGCDQVSSFGGKGKISAWETWNIFPEVTPAFIALSDLPSKEVVQRIHQFSNASSCCYMTEPAIPVQ